MCKLSAVLVHAQVSPDHLGASFHWEFRLTEWAMTVLPGRRSL